MGIKAGQIIAVENTKRPHFTNAKTSYYLVWVEDHTGGNERPLMLTHKELQRIINRASKNSEDLISTTDSNALVITDSSIVRGRLIPVWNKNRRYKAENTYYYALLVEGINSGLKCLLFTEAELTKVEYRANRNKEDIVKKGFIADLLD